MAVTRRINLEENIAKGAQRIADALRHVSKAKRDSDKATEDAQHIADALRRLKNLDFDADKVKR